MSGDTQRNVCWHGTNQPILGHSLAICPWIAQNEAMGARGRRWPSWLLPLALVPLAASCSAGQVQALGQQSPIEQSSTGIEVVQHPVSQLDLAAMVPPGGTALMPAAVSGTGPVPLDYGSLGPAAGKQGIITIAFVCDGVNSSGVPLGGWATWNGPDGTQASVACNPAPDQEAGCDEEVQSCAGQDVNLVTLPNGAGAALPALQIPAAASWSLFAWLDPHVQPATAGVSKGPPGLSHFVGYGLALDYPAAWKALAPPDSFWGMDYPTSSLFLSTAPLTEPCKITADKNGNISRGPCHTPVRALAPGGVFVTWTYTGPGSDQLSSQPGRATTLAGQSAQLVSAPPQSSTSYGAGTCQSLHAGWLVAAAISLGPDSIDRMVACVRAASTSPQVKEVMAMLHSLRLPDSRPVQA
jgi:hypothetical protein